jgi:hypothetical protein
MGQFIPLKEICLDASQYPIKIRRRKNGQVKLTFLIPITTPLQFSGLSDKDPFLPREYTQARITLIVSPEDLQKLADADRGLLGACIACQCAVADSTIHPRPFPKRKRVATLIKRWASNEAKDIYPTIKYLLQHPEGQSARFRQVLSLVKASKAQMSVDPHLTPVDITAWLIEQLHEEEWESSGLRRPMTSIERFPKEYLYTKLHMIRCTPDNLPDRAYSLEKVLQEVLSS